MRLGAAERRAVPRRPPEACGRGGGPRRSRVRVHPDLMSPAPGPHPLSAGAGALPADPCISAHVFPVKLRCLRLPSRGSCQQRGPATRSLRAPGAFQGRRCCSCRHPSLGRAPRAITDQTRWTRPGVRGLEPCGQGGPESGRASSGASREKGAQHGFARVTLQTHGCRQPGRPRRARGQTVRAAGPWATPPAPVGSASARGGPRSDKASFAKSRRGSGLPAPDLRGRGMIP